MVNEQRKAKKGRLTVKDQIALRLGQLMDQHGPAWALIGNQLAAEGFSGNLITKVLQAQKAAFAAAPPSDVSDSVIAESEGPATAVEAVAMAVREVIGRAAAGAPAPQEITEALNVATDQIGNQIQGLSNRMGILESQIGMINQALQHLDPARIAKALEPPALRQTVRQAAEEIRSGARPPRHKLGVTVDGALWAAVEEIQRRQRRTASDILDEALKLWVDEASRDRM